MGTRAHGAVEDPFHIPQVGLNTTSFAALEPRRLVEEDGKQCRDHDVPGLYLSCFDKLYTEDIGWTPRLPEVPKMSVSLTSFCREPEQCPVVDSQDPENRLEERSLEQVQSLVVGEVLKDIETACKLLNISDDPMEWSVGHVQKWVLWTEHLYKLPPVGKEFQELSGKDMCAMSEAGFRERVPRGGDVLHAHLDIWKSAAWMQESCASKGFLNGGGGHWSEADSSSAAQPIHLWQFLKDLLLRPHSYGRCIRWINKEKGIFKIEDSAQVARLWGLRKNRPAMNYDKLSRSIRQYYKKGIIRKPPVSQRLVYQFVHPV